MAANPAGPGGGGLGLEPGRDGKKGEYLNVEGWKPKESKPLPTVPNLVMGGSTESPPPGLRFFF